MRLAATSQGTGQTTTQASVAQGQRFFEGTYATRIRFSDAPDSGPDGDQVVQTFYTISQLNYPLDPNYSELDYEYLPNGGLGSAGTALQMVTWETYQDNPWDPRALKTLLSRSHDGWHLLKLDVTGGEVRYYIDGVLVASHGGDYAPEAFMFLKYAVWFANGGLVSSSTNRRYFLDVDWVYHVRDASLTTTQVEYRRRRVPRRAASRAATPWCRGPWSPPTHTCEAARTRTRTWGRPPDWRSRTLPTSPTPTWTG